MLFVHKMVSTKVNDRFYALGRVFTGTVKTGQQVRIMGPNYKPGSRNELNVKNLKLSALLVGGNIEAVPSVPCGNMVALVGIDKYLLKQGTISDHEQSFCIREPK